MVSKKSDDLENHRLIIGDQVVYFIDAKRVKEILEPESVHLIITSPPYWNVKDYGDPSQIGFGQSYNNYISSLNEVWNACETVLRPNGKIAVNLAPIPVSTKETGLGRSSIIDIMADVHSYMRQLDLDLSNIFIWDKRKYNNQRIFGSYPFPPNFFSHIAFEYIHLFRKKGSTESRDIKIKEKSKLTKKEWSSWCFNSVWDISPVIKINARGENVFGHIAPFPEELVYRLIRMFSFIGDIVLDPFLGSGTTLKVCQLTKRQGIGFEIVDQYKQMIQQRICESWDPIE